MSCNRKCSSAHSKFFAVKAEKKSSLFCINSSVVVAVTQNVDLHSNPQFGVYSNTMPEITFKKIYDYFVNKDLFPK